MMMWRRWREYRRLKRKVRQSVADSLTKWTPESDQQSRDRVRGLLDNAAERRAAGEEVYDTSPEPLVPPMQFDWGSFWGDLEGDFERHRPKAEVVKLIPRKKWWRLK